jgi:glyoxylase-like metal-dependent hydrolase (beta-lactamase superfamily II)
MFAETKVELVPVAGDISRFSGPLANCTVLKNSAGVLVVDSSEKAEIAKEMLHLIRPTGTGNVDYLINTHWHFDHVDGNGVFHDAGATIVAQKAVRSKLEKTPTQDNQPLMPATSLPEICFPQELTIFFGGETVYIYHPETDGAHTSGDAAVYFKTTNVLATGDILFVGMYPYVDSGDNGWPQGMAASLRDLARMIDDKTLVIPGHGPVTNRQALLDNAVMLDDVGNRIQALMKEGKTLDEIKAAKPTAKWDAAYSKPWMSGDAFTELVWNCLKNHH